MTTVQTTVSKLTPGARVLVVLRHHSPMVFASMAGSGTRAAEVRAVEPAGRKRRVITDLGEIEAGPTARVLLAPPAEPEPAPIMAMATVDHMGRLTPFSVVSVRTNSRRVPHVVPVPGGGIAERRLSYVLREMGYRTRGQWDHAGKSEAGRGLVACPVEPLPAEDAPAQVA